MYQIQNRLDIAIEDGGQVYGFMTQVHDLIAQIIAQEIEMRSKIGNKSSNKKIVVQINMSTHYLKKIVVQINKSSDIETLKVNRAFFM